MNADLACVGPEGCSPRHSIIRQAKPSSSTAQEVALPGDSLRQRPGAEMPARAPRLSRAQPARFRSERTRRGRPWLRRRPGPRPSGTQQQGQANNACRRASSSTFYDRRILSSLAPYDVAGIIRQALPRHSLRGVLRHAITALIAIAESMHALRGVVGLRRLTAGAYTRPLLSST